MPHQGSGWLAPAIAALALTAALAIAGYAASTDSATVDEPSHLVAGYAALHLGDHRLSPDHPPLARLLLALPLAGGGTNWRPEAPAAAAAWRQGDFFTLGREFLESWNDGQRLVRRARIVAIAMLGALLLTLFLVARKHFGAGGGAVALCVAAFDPNLLAHGHLATIDVPFALAALFALLAADRWLARPDGQRLALLGLAFAAAALTKFSFFALVPALLAMTIAAGRGRGAASSLRSIGRAAAAVAAVTLLAAWAIYGFRFEAARGEDAAAATMHVLGDYGRPLPTTPAAAWESVLHDPKTGEDRPGIAAPLLRLAHRARILPEAYLYGAAYVAKKGLTRASYLRGRYSMTGFPEYFPIAFAIKTPLPALALYLLGLATLLAAWRRRGFALAAVPPLAWGCAVFAAVYLAALSASALNIGFRHLLPATVLLALAAGAAWPRREDGEPARRIRQVAVVALLAWQAAGTLLAAPRLLGYFNESVGGWRQGHRYLADSNLDWGQDLLRLEARLRQRPEAAVWLVQAGDPPLPAGLAELRPRWLIGEGSHAPHPAPIGPGLYAIGATELLGVYRPLARAESWRDPRWIARYEQEAGQAAARGENPPADGGISSFEALRRLRLIARLAQREPDERVGASLFLYRLDERQLAEATAP